MKMDEFAPKIIAIAEKSKEVFNKGVDMLIEKCKEQMEKTNSNESVSTSKPKEEIPPKKEEVPPKKDDENTNIPPT